jgi:hypothetical protein
MAVAVALAWLCGRPAFGQQAPGGQAPAAERDSAQAVRAEVDRLRQEFEALKRQYGDRLAALEARLASLEPGRADQPVPPASAPVQAPPIAEVPAGAAGAGGPSGSLPVYGNPSILSKIFNPDIAVMGNFLAAAGSNEIAPRPAFEMNEAELSLQAVVDPFARADFFLGFGSDGSVDIEEGYITFTSLPAGLLAKAGKLRGAFGKANPMHTHVLPWTDRPLVTDNLLGGEEGIADSGVSVSRLIPNPWFFFEATAEFYRGESEIFRAPTASALTYVARLRGYQDLSEASNLDLGTSFAFGHNDAGPEATTELVGVDATFRYRPLRRAASRRFLARTELVWSRRSELAGQPRSFGTYVSAEYQFSRRWFAGVRFDYADRATDPSLADKGGSLLLTFWPSEFGQLRGQYRRTRYAEGTTANEFLFQVLFSIGAHGAHLF